MMQGNFYVEQLCNMDTSKYLKYLSYMMGILGWGVWNCPFLRCVSNWITVNSCWKFLVIYFNLAQGIEGEWR